MQGSIFEMYSFFTECIETLTRTLFFNKLFKSFSCSTLFISKAFVVIERLDWGSIFLDMSSNSGSFLLRRGSPPKIAKFVMSKYLDQGVKSCFNFSGVMVPPFKTFV